MGSSATVQAALGEFIDRTHADELIVVAQIFDHAARLRSYELTAAARKEKQRQLNPVTRSSLTGISSSRSQSPAGGLPCLIDARFS